MSTVIKEFSYSGGRGRGLLGLSSSGKLLSKKPGAQKAETSTISIVMSSVQSSPADTSNQSKGSNKLLVAMHNYSANPDSPGGFPELSVRKGQLLTLCNEHPDNEHWWEVRNEDGDVGYIPSSYVIIRDDQCLPWLQLSALKSEEEERKARVKRLAQQKSAAEGRGFGPAPKSSFNVPKAYVSAYSSSSMASSQDRYYCEVCDKRLNGPKPYSAHMASRAHKEEVAALEYQ